MENYFNLYIQVTTLDKVRNAGREILSVQIVSFKWRLIVPNRLNYSGTCSRVKYNDKINIGIFYFIKEKPSLEIKIQRLHSVAVFL